MMKKTRAKPWIVGIMKKKKDWLIVLFKKEKFDRELEDHAMCTFKRTYNDVVVLAFHGEERKITRLCHVLQGINEALIPSLRSVLMQIDSEGIIVYE